MYGIALGKVDATVEVKIDRRAKIKRRRPDTGNQVQTQVIPLELKTGKMFTKLGEFQHLSVFQFFSVTFTLVLFPPPPPHFYSFSLHLQHLKPAKPVKRPKNGTQAYLNEIPSHYIHEIKTNGDR